MSDARHPNQPAQRQRQPRRTAPGPSSAAEPSPRRFKPGEAIALGTSVVLHAALLLVLAAIVIPPETMGPVLDLVFRSRAEPIDVEPDLTEVPLEQPEVIGSHPRAAQAVADVTAENNRAFAQDIDKLDPSRVLRDDPLAVSPNSPAPLDEALAGRTEAGRAALVARFGGTEASEAAVVAGLTWLAEHQNDDGSWSFDHTRDACRGSCTEAGTLDDGKMGATAMALLAFMGAGHTFAEGDFQPVVARGLNYLMTNAEIGRNGADLRDGQTGNPGMYIQGLATIAVCEALTMNEMSLAAEEKRGRPAPGRAEPRLDLRERLRITRALRRVAQAAVRFIQRAQDPQSGGWRYRPRRGGDTSVVGWQIMALHSAKSAELTVPQGIFREASGFLDSVQADGGAKYGYRGPAAKPSTTAIGLLCRIYLGWDRTNAALGRGVEYLGQVGPAESDMYYNYYATQVMLQWGGDAYAKLSRAPDDLTPDEQARAQIWKTWNDAMRTRLVETQRKEGHAKGSWDLADTHGRQGGRLYMTCLCTMTLEVYYRHLPLYRHQPDEPQPARAER